MNKQTFFRKRLLSVVLSVACSAVLMTGISSPVYADEPVSLTVAAGGNYQCVYAHDPRINSKAMSDIVVNPDAVYGFSPDPESTRLGEYATLVDWTNPEALEAARQERIAYLAAFNNQYKLWQEMSDQGKTIEEIARAVSALRNENRLASYANNPEGLATVKKSNLETYGNENGPTAESLFEKYGSWEKVLIKSFSSNSGMDACLGLYDVQYEHNKLTEAIVENQNIVYTVKPGDYLIKIAQKYYGDAKAWKYIYDANEDSIAEGYVIFSGEKLIIP